MVVVLIALGFLADGAISIRRGMSNILDRVQPLRAAAFELEINVNGTALGVVKYLHHVDPRFRDRFVKDGNDFRRFLKVFMLHATDA